MKKTLTLITAIFCLNLMVAQDFTDALRYSQDEINGTARFRAMGGAFGALGGDLSAINLNPASSSVFNSSQGSITIGLTSVNNDVSYFGAPNNSNTDNINLTPFR